MKDQKTPFSELIEKDIGIHHEKGLITPWLDRRYPGQHEFNVTLDYHFQKSWMKNLWIRLRGGWNRRDHEDPGGGSTNNYHLQDF